MSSVGSRRSSRPPLPSREIFAACGARRRGSRRRRRPSAARGSVGNSLAHARRRARRPSRRRSGARRRARAARRWRRPGSPRRRAGRPRSASARPIRPLERLPMKRTESIGSRVPPAVTRTRSPSHGPARRRQQRLDLGQQALGRRAAGRRRARRARRARPPRARSRVTPRSRSVARFAWVAASRVHAVVHRRGDERAAPCRRGTRWSASSRRSRRRAWRSCWPTPARPGRRRRWRPARGGRSGRGRAAGRRGRRRAAGRARTRRSSTGAPTMPSKEAAPTKRVAAGVISTRTPWPARVARRASSSAL